MARDLRAVRGEARAVVAPQRIARVDDHGVGALCERGGRAGRREQEQCEHAQPAPQRTPIYCFQPTVPVHIRPASIEPPAVALDRAALRARLLAARAAFLTGPAFEPAAAALGRELREVIERLEPACLGCYWPHRGEFNAATALDEDKRFANLARALPFARRDPPSLEYRGWDGGAPGARDACGIPSSDGAPVRPDVVLVPCVGYTLAGHRLGYGGGYFDRWLAEHPQVCAVGVAWSHAQLEEVEFAPAAHDVRLALVVTERGVH
jgi:5,10-methenyltetrahydrofolate synthetase